MTAESAALLAHDSDLLEEAPLAFVVTGPGGIIERWNGMAQQLFGWTAEELVGRVSRICPPERVDEMFALVERAESGETITGFQTMRRHKNGHDIPVSLGVKCVNGSLVWTIVDVSEQRALNKALAASKRQLRAQNAELARLQQEKQELAALVVHDLKSPLSTILANLRFVMREPVLSVDSREALRDSQAAGEALHRMVLNLLDVSRSEESSLPAICQSFAIGELVEGVAAGARHRLDERKQRIETSCGLSSPTIHSDPELVRRIVENLVDNAMKYGGTGGTISVCVVEDGTCVRIVVSDEGAGIPAEMRERIFDRNVRLSNDDAHARSSRGLGLAFCRLAVEALGGTIRVEDNTPRGARFVARIPR